MSRLKIQMTGTMLSHSLAPPAASAYSGKEERAFQDHPREPLGDGGA